MNAERHSFSATTFNNSGKLLQIEYANWAGTQGEPVVGIRATDGIVVAAEKYLRPKLAIPSTVVKVESLRTGMILSYAGLLPDFRYLLSRIRQIGDQNYMQFGRGLTVKTTLNFVSSTMQEYCQTSGYRPFGLSIILAGCENNRSYLYHLTAEGNHALYKSLAIGRNADHRMDFMHKYYHRRLTLDFAICLALHALRLDNVCPFKADNYEICICTEDGFQRLHLETIDLYVHDME